MEKVNQIKVNPLGTGQIAFYKTENTIVCSGLQEGVSIWDAITGELKHKLPSSNDMHRSIDISLDSKTLAVSGDRTGISLWNTETWNKLSNIDTSIGAIINISYDATGKLIGLQNISSYSVEIYNILANTLVSKLPFGSFAFHPYKPEIAIANQTDISLFNIDTANLISSQKFLESITSSFSFSPDGNLLLFETLSERAYLVSINSVSKPTAIDEYSLVRCPTFSPSGEMIAIVNVSGFVSIYDTKSNTKIGTIKGNFDSPSNLSFNYDESLLACGSGGASGGIIEVWNIN